jgi:hypothetical protein
MAGWTDMGKLTHTLSNFSLEEAKNDEDKNDAMIK